MTEAVECGLVDADDDGRVALDRREDRGAWPIAPRVAGIERILLPIARVETGEGAHQEPGVAIE